MNPKVTVHLNKLRDNIQYLSKKIKDKNISIIAVTKVYSADPAIIHIFEEFPEIEYFGDSRIENLKSYQHSSKKKILIRIPMPSEVAEVIQYADISFHSELSTIYQLNQAAKKYNKIHQVLLMVDLGDLREGFFEKEELMSAVKAIIEMENIQLIGLGVNFTCYGAIIPENSNLNQLINYKHKIERDFHITLPMISGGNSSSLYLLEDKLLPQEINNLRIGESFALGRETAFGNEYKEMHKDVFTLSAEIIELKRKPSLPIGQVGVDAFGNKPSFEDKGNMLRGILAIGKQDISVDNITPIDTDLKIIGASSDHLIIDFTNAKKEYHVGDSIQFHLDYGALLAAFTSKYVKKEYVDWKE